jgi:hypothetical protein
MTEVKETHISIWYKILCILSLTYVSVYSLIFVLGIFNLPLLNKIFNLYTTINYSHTTIVFFVSLNLLLGLSSLFGIVKLYRFKKKGYYILLFSLLLLIAVKLFFNNKNLIEIGFISFLILLFTVNIKKYN